MPISRYEIRNEYSLADPELFRAADKDDPEALLEGVAMAGLVGVLRQLGDLAEFAAEIFHDLHEEVMSTAARGHGLMIRVQQLEAEVPSIEKAFLSQTDHSSFFYNSGVDWHPNPRMDQNLVTKGDLPRFVMDSYEECRGPPRLFLLDKFDVAGAGACLKRYTDPSFFKVETSMANANVQREKKSRKVKKKGPHGRYEETPELLPASHAKLHHLFLEEPDEKGVSRPSHRARLKRRPNGFPFDSKTGKSYMEKFLNTPSPEPKMLHGITASSSLWMSTNDQNESDLDILELRSVSPARESGVRKLNPPPPDWEDTLNPFMNQTNDESTDIKMTNRVPSTFDENGEKDITVYGDRKTEGSLTGYQSDDIASEIDNYMDAPSTIESEMETDSELRVKNDFTSSNIKSQSSVSVKNGAHLHSQSSDSQSTGDLTISDEGSNSCKKEVSSFLSSASSRTSSEKPHSENVSAEGFPSADVPEVALINSSVYQKTPDEDIPVEGLPEHVVSSGIFSGKDARPIKSPKFEQRASIFGSCNSIPILPRCEKKTNVIKYTPRVRSVSHSKSLSGDDSSSSGEQDAPCTSNIAEIISHTTDSPAAISAYLLHDDNDHECLNQYVNITSTLNMGNVLSQDRVNAEEIISTEGITLANVGDEVPKLPKNFAFDSTDIAHTEDVITSKDSVAENQNDNLFVEDSKVVSDAPNRFSYTMGASIGKEFRETSLMNAKTASSEDHYSNSSVVNQIRSETLVFLKSEDSPDVQEAGHDTHDRDFIPKEVNTVNEIPEVETPKSCEVVGLHCTGKMDEVTPNDLKDSAGPSDMAQKDGFSSGSGFSSSTSDMKLLSEVRVHLDESDSEIDQSETEPIACCIPAISDNTVTEDVNLPAGVRKLVEEHIRSFDDTGLGCEHENDETSSSGSNRESELVKANKNYHSGSQGQSSLVEEMKAREDATLHYHTVSCSTENNDQPESKSEVPYAVMNSYYESEVEHSLDFVSATQIQSPLEQSGFDTAKYFQRSGVENQVSDANSSPIDCASEETMLQENFELPPDQIEQVLPGSGDKKSELSSILPSNHQKMLDQINNEGHNNLASLSPHFSCPPSLSGLSGQSNYGSDITAYPKDSSGFVFPPSNLFSQTNQINLDELPPMPPLPPLQWRMGMLQHTSYTTEAEKMEHKEESLHNISPPAASTSNVSSLAQTNNPPTQIPPQISLKEENLEQKSPNLVANSKHDPIGLSPKIEYAQHQLVMPTQKNDDGKQHQLVIPTKNDDWEQHQLVMPTQKNDDGEQHQLVMPTQKDDDDGQHQLVMPSQKDDDDGQHQLVMPTQKNDDGEQHQLVMPTQKNDDGEQHQLVMPTQKNDDGEQHQLVMPTQKNDGEQHLLVMPTQKNDDGEQHLLVMPIEKNDEGTSPAVEDGVASGSRTVKLPRSCNPVIGSAAALDKSKLRKVTEHDRPQIQKPDERDSLLEQIRTKSFNLKPAVASRPSVRGPNTNLKVAAILEKANAIRQALAGSDEDDEDNWSDS